MNLYQKIDHFLVQIAYLDQENLEKNFNEIDFSNTDVKNYFISNLINLNKKTTQNDPDNFLKIFIELKINEEYLEELMMQEYEAQNRFNSDGCIFANYLFNKYHKRIFKIIENDQTFSYMNCEQIFKVIRHIKFNKNASYRHTAYHKLLRDMYNSSLLKPDDREIGLNNLGLNINFLDLIVLMGKVQSYLAEKLYFYHQKNKKNYLNIFQLSLQNSQRLLSKDNGILNEILNESDEKTKKDFYTYMFKNYKTYKNVINQCLDIDPTPYIIYKISTPYRSSNLFTDELIKKLEMLNLHHNLPHSEDNKTISRKKL